MAKKGLGAERTPNVTNAVYAMTRASAKTRTTALLPVNAMVGLLMGAWIARNVTKTVLANQPRRVARPAVR